jgi:hypothetical protein
MQREFVLLPIEESAALDQRSNGGDGEREGIDPGVLFPSILSRRGAFARDEAQTFDRVFDRDFVQCMRWPRARAAAPEHGGRLCQHPRSQQHGHVRGKAIMAVAASILAAVYDMLEDGTMYKDLGCNHFDRRSTDKEKQRLVKRLAA